MTEAAPAQPAGPLGDLVAVVQANCHIADARHATDLSLCNYLLQMREFYRWEQGVALGAPLSKADVGSWLHRREQLWGEVEQRAFAALPPGDIDPFDADATREPLAARGLVYGAGLAARGRPVFFLAQLQAQQPLPDTELQLQLCGRELARGLYAPPAALADRTVVLRRDALARWLWQLVEAHGLRRSEGAFHCVMSAYGWDAQDPSSFHAGLPAALDELGDMLVLHELGEHRAGLQLGPAWAGLRLSQLDRRTDLALQALRDLLADLDTTVPGLLARGADTALHFWWATFEGLRAQWCPLLKPAYAAWCAGDQGRALRDAARRGHRHFSDLAARVLALHAGRSPTDAAGAIAALLAGDGPVCDSP
jgi:hypothetical protein